MRYFIFWVVVVVVVLLAGSSDAKPQKRPIRVLMDHKTSRIETIDVQTGSWYIGIELEMLWLDDELGPQFYGNTELGSETTPFTQEVLAEPTTWYPDLVYGNESYMYISDKWDKDHNLVLSFHPDVANKHSAASFYTGLAKKAFNPPNGSKDLVWMHKKTIEASLLHTFDIHLFPFDYHVLYFSAHLTKEISRRQLVDYKFFRGGLHEDLVFHPTEFKLVDSSATVTNMSDLTFLRFGGRGLSCYTINYHVARSMNYYFWKFYLCLILIVIASLMIYWINPLDIATRTSIGMTCFLAAVAFSFMTENLPVVSYLTRLDIFLVVCFILLFYGLIESLLVFRLSQVRKKEKKRLQREETGGEDGATDGPGETSPLLQRVASKFNVISPIPVRAGPVLPRLIDVISLWLSVLVLIYVFIYTTPFSCVHPWMPGFDEVRYSQGHLFV